jgi:enediyne biosynthesis protein E4
MITVALCLATRPLPVPQAQNASTARPVTFADVTKASGISWTHDNGRSDARHLPETCGGGGLFFDYNNDGLMDIYLVNSGPSDFLTPKTPIKNALYRNNGDGTFTDITEKSGVAAPNWSTCATFFDYDNDGKLDLFVSSFVQYSASGSVFCGDNRLGRRYYCIPRVFKPRPSFLFHNDGGGKFSDVSRASGIADSPGKSFGAVATDVNNDGMMDLFVANDTMANYLFVNKGGGKFEEMGLASGVGYSDSGSPRSGMGVDATDFDGDGWQDLFVANIDQELFSLYHNEKDLTFTDRAGEIGQATRLLSGWGLKFFDYDNDGDPDLILANGHPDDMVEIQAAKVKYKEPLLMFDNVNGKFKNVSAQSGEVFKRDFPARGLSVGDIDNDGDLDVLIINNGDAPILLRNEGGNRNNWLGLQLVATKSNPGAVGAVITWTAGGVKRSRLKTSGGSYLASHDPREILGVGQAAKIDGVEIKWPSGKVDNLANPPINQYVKVVEGEGIVKSTATASAKQQ